MSYTYLVADLVSGVILDELPLFGVTFDKRLNDTGSMRGQLRVDDPAMRATGLRAFTEPGRTAVYVDRDGELLWGGIVWTTRYAAANRTLEIGASDFLSYFERRRVLRYPVSATGVVGYTDVDQVDIAADLIDLTQDQPGGDLGVRLRGPRRSGVRRTLSYAAGELKPVADALRDLSNAEGGFDLAADVEYAEDGRPVRFIRLGHPRLGQPGGPYVWEFGVNLTDFTWPRDAGSMATRCFAQGSGEGDTPLLRYAEDTGAYADGWPLLEDGSSQVDTVDPALLLAQANGSLAAHRRPVVLPELTVRADLDPVLGSYEVGDDVRIVIDDPYLAAQPVDVVMRLLSFEVTPGDDADLEEVRLTVAPIPEPT